MPDCSAITPPFREGRTPPAVGRSSYENVNAFHRGGPSPGHVRNQAAEIVGEGIFASAVNRLSVGAGLGSDRLWICAVPADWIRRPLYSRCGRKAGR
jgi:hypothetical protein